MHRNSRRWMRGFGWPVPMAMQVNGCRADRTEGTRGRSRDGGGFFGPDGLFGPRGPFGPGGPFGPDGPFGPGGPFGGDNGGHWNRKARDGWDRQYRGRRRGRMFATGELRLLLLHLISQQPRHGYELIRAIEEMTAGTYAPSPGTVYPTLSLLEDEGAIREVAGGDEPRKAFEATDKGREELEERREEAEVIAERIAGHGERHAERGKAFATPEMFRALGNLAQVVKNKARSDGLHDDAVAQIVDLIDEMARRIERI